MLVVGDRISSLGFDSNLAMETHRKVRSDVIFSLRRLHAHVVAVTVRHTGKHRASELAMVGHCRVLALAG